jgi:hypothetical protein
MAAPQDIKNTIITWSINLGVHPKELKTET